MNIKKLKEELNKFPEDKEVYITVDCFDTLSFPIKSIEESHTLDEDEPSIVLIKSLAMRTRFRTNRIASSNNYRRSRELHIEFLQEFHNAHIEEIEQVIVKKQKYVRVFGKLIPISEEELRIHNTLVYE